jgi:hypothetical protein
LQLHRTSDHTTTRRRLRREVRAFGLGDATPPQGAWVTTRELLPAVVAYLRVGRRFRRRGLAAALELVPSAIGPRSVLPHTPQTAFCARSAAGRILGLARTFGGRHLCLHESVAITAALRRLGFAVEAVVGYPVIELATGAEELHAWPQLGEETVTDRLGSAPMNFVELARYPRTDGAVVAGVSA